MRSASSRGSSSTMPKPKRRLSCTYSVPNTRIAKPLYLPDSEVEKREWGTTMVTGSFARMKRFRGSMPKCFYAVAGKQQRLRNIRVEGGSERPSLLSCPIQNVIMTGPLMDAGTLVRKRSNPMYRTCPEPCQSQGPGDRANLTFSQAVVLRPRSNSTGLCTRAT